MKTLLRWLALLPGAVAAGVLSTFVLHLVLYATLEKFVTPYPKSLELALRPLAVALSFIYAGASIAPRYQLRVGLLLFSTWIFIAGGLIMSTWTPEKLLDSDLYLKENGISVTMGIVGAFYGLYLVWKKSMPAPITLPDKHVPGTNSELKENNDIEQPKTSFYNRYKNQIYPFVFTALYAWSVFNTTVRTVFFVIMLVIISAILAFSIKEKIYTTIIMKVNLARDIVLIVALTAGLINKETGFYVSAVCATLSGFELIRSFFPKRS